MGPVAVPKVRGGVSQDLQVVRHALKVLGQGRPSFRVCVGVQNMVWLTVRRGQHPGLGPVLGEPKYVLDPALSGIRISVSP